MKKIKFTNLIADTFSSSKILNFLIFLFFAIMLTAILSAKYFLFQSIINDDNTSKKNIVAYKTIKVVDTFKTEQTKKEVAQKIEPVLTPAEDSYIKNNFNSLERNITEIRKKNIDYNAKRDELNLLFDIDNNYDRSYVLNFLINAKDEKLATLFKKSEKSLDGILKQGVTEKDFEFAFFDQVDEALMSGWTQNKEFFSLLLNNEDIQKEVLGIFIPEVYRQLRASTQNEYTTVTK